MHAEKTRAEISRVAIALEDRRARAKLLEEIAWPRQVEEEFFSKGAGALPEVKYELNRDEIEARIATLSAVEKSIDGDLPVHDWLRKNVRSMLDGNLLMSCIGTREFSERSRELYGSSKTRFFHGKHTNLDLAEHLMERLRIHGWDEAMDPEVKAITAPELVVMLRERVERRIPKMAIEIALDDRTTAKVVAGMSRVRVRPDATFAPWEAEGLWHHEIETHALSAHNGSLQTNAPFLRAGGPRTTRTQEGLAIFAELYTKSLSIARVERLALRVKLVDMAEDGASFLDLYRFLLARGSSPRDAYFDAQRVCRGGLVEGGSPFTKDASYLSGLLEVFAFLSAVMRGGFRDEVELLVCGRIHLDDIAVLAELRARGILKRPHYLPDWLASWETLLPFFAFTSFMDGIDLAPVEAHFDDLIKSAEAAKPHR